jgi:hypothetical protein
MNARLAALLRLVLDRQAPFRNKGGRIAFSTA